MDAGCDCLCRAARGACQADRRTPPPATSRGRAALAARGTQTHRGGYVHSAVAIDHNGSLGHCRIGCVRAQLLRGVVQRASSGRPAGDHRCCAQRACSATHPHLPGAPIPAHDHQLVGAIRSLRAQEGMLGLRVWRAPRTGLVAGTCCARWPGPHACPQRGKQLALMATTGTPEGKTARYWRTS